MTAPRSASSSATAVSKSSFYSSPSALSVASLLSSCRSLLGLQQIHAHIVRKGLEQHPVLATRFLSLCAAFSAPAYASSSFDRIASPNLITWNALLGAHARCSPLPTIVSLFNLLRQRSPVPPDEFTFPSLLSSCSRSEEINVGSSVHATILRCGLETDVFVGTALVDFYRKCREVGAARKLFDSLLLRNEVSWTVMIAGYLSSGDQTSARSLFDEMPKRNVVTWNSMIDGYVKSGDLVSARELFDEMPQKDAISYTSLIDGYAKAGDLASAKFLFEQSPDKDLFSWSAMISGFAQNGRPGDALKIFLEMHNLNIKPDDHIVVGLLSACSQIGSLMLAKWVDSYVIKNGIDITKAHVLAALIDMNAKCGNMERAARLFESMPSKDLISYSSLMQGYSIHGAGHKALELFSQMLEEGLLPDDVTFTVVLTACSYAGLVEEGKKYFELMNKYRIVPSSDHYACMVDLLGRAGRLKEAYDLIKSMVVEPHAGAWGALLGACKIHGDIELGEVISKRLFELEPTNAGNYVVLSNIYAVADRWADVPKVRATMREKGIRKLPGCTWS
ncbi:putative pentatricopeptide repeat-containing protein At5g37570 [Zingiber officinale]|uniref:putative pentatricopeptide repeat-containing protein At5g37570 n=1 Tax=Zingiber officinale TaxID=94328 RepID=UPI001C4BEF19|nr:putative pentatricopeptide repeat-containing protein At5g37570 [Zingiber officinale]